jgi:anti-sigma B factor antagonist
MLHRIEERQPGVLVVSIAGRITVENGDGALLQIIEEALALRPTHAIVDLADVPMIDSCGLGELVAAYQRARRFGCGLSVVRPNDRVLEVLRVTRLAAILVDRSPEFAGAAALA